MVNSIKPMDQAHSEAPKDHFKLVYFAFYYTGLNILFPYMMLINVMHLWNFKFRDTSIPYDTADVSMTPAQKQLPSLLSLSSNLPIIFSVILTILFGWRASLRTRLLIPLTLQIACFSCLLALVVLDTDEWQDTLMIVFMFTNVVYSSAFGVFRASIMGNISRFPIAYIGSIQGGVGLGQVLPAIISILCLVWSPLPTTLGLVCLAMSLGFLLLQLPVILLLGVSPFYKHHIQGSDKSRPPGWGECLKVIKSNSLYLLVILVNYLTDFALHPAVTALLRPAQPENDSPWKEKYFVPVCCFLVQALWEWIGTSLASLLQWPRPGFFAELVCIGCQLVRLAIIPLIMRCNVAPMNRTTQILFKDDWVFVLLFSIYSVSSGYISNIALMYAPKKLSPELQEVSGQLLISSLVLGRGLGSALGPALVSLL